MVLTHVIVEVEADKCGRFESIARSITSDALELAGCIRSEWYRDPDVPGTYVLHGAFESMAHFRAYRESDVVARIGNELLPLLASEPEFRHYEATVFERSDRDA